MAAQLPVALSSSSSPVTSTKSISDQQVAETIPLWVLFAFSDPFLGLSQGELLHKDAFCLRALRDEGKGRVLHLGRNSTMDQYRRGTWVCWWMTG